MDIPTEVLIVLARKCVREMSIPGFCGVDVLKIGVTENGESQSKSEHGMARGRWAGGGE